MVEARAGPLIELPLTSTAPKASVAQFRSFWSFSCVSRLTVSTPPLPAILRLQELVVGLRSPCAVITGVVRVHQKLGEAGIPQVVGRKAACGIANLRGKSIPGFLMHSAYDDIRNTSMEKSLTSHEQVSSLTLWGEGTCLHYWHYAAERERQKNREGKTIQ